MKRSIILIILSAGCTLHALYKTKLRRSIDTSCNDRSYPETAIELKTQQDIQRYIHERAEFIKKNSQLIVAVWRKNLPLVQQLLTQGADVNTELENYQNDRAGVPLWCWRLFTVRDAQDKQILDALLTDDVGFVEDYRDGNGFTPFIVAAILGYLDVAKFLYQKGARVNEKDHLGLTALWHWVLKNNAEAVDFLLACPGINLGVKTLQQESLLEYAVIQNMPKIAEALLGSSVAKLYISQEEKDVLLKRIMYKKNGPMMQILIRSGAQYQPPLKQIRETTLVAPQPKKMTEFIITDIDDSEEPEKSLLDAPLTTSSDSSHDSIVEQCDDIDKAFISIR